MCQICGTQTGILKKVSNSIIRYCPPLNFPYTNDCVPPTYSPSIFSPTHSPSIFYVFHQPTPPQYFHLPTPPQYFMFFTYLLPLNIFTYPLPLNILCFSPTYSPSIFCFPPTYSPSIFSPTHSASIFYVFHLPTPPQYFKVFMSFQSTERDLSFEIKITNMRIWFTLKRTETRLYPCQPQISQAPFTI